MPDRISYVVNRFPDLVSAIRQYASDNRFFCSLCEDYGEAVDLLRRIENNNDSEAFGHLTVCHELIADLEEEILNELRLWNEGERGVNDRTKP